MKKTLMVCIVCAIISMLPAQTPTYIITEDCPLYDMKITPDGDVYNIATRATKGELVTLMYIPIEDPTIEAYSVFINYYDDQFFINTKYLIPSDTQDLFDESALTPYNSETVWIRDYCADVLFTGNRQLIRMYEEQLINIVGEPHEYSDGWYSFVGLPLVITQCSINVVADFRGFITNIRKHDNAYEIYMKRYSDDLPTYLPESTTDEYVLFFQYDGDYLIISEGRIENIILRFIRVDRNFHEKVLNVIRNDEEQDLSSITFPRYADGTSDYDIREERYQQEGGVYRIQESLRVRNGEGTHSSILTTLDPNTEVTVLRIGSEALIDKIKSNWVHVQLTDGTTGWCFGGYLREETVAESHEKTEELRRVQEAQQEAESKKKAAQDALEQQALAQQRRTVFFIVIGGIVLLAIVISAVVILTQKKQKKQKK